VGGDGKAGLDSLGALELHGAIADAFAIQLPATAAFDFPSLAALAARILQLAQPAPAEPHAVRTGVDALDATERMQCYVLGIGCRFPGNSSRTGTACSAARACVLTGTAARASEPCRARVQGIPHSAAPSRGRPHCKVKRRCSAGTSMHTTTPPALLARRT